MNLEGANISINFFDLSGNDDYKVIREEFYEDAQGILMVYDVDNRDSFVNLIHWETEMRNNGIDPSQTKIVV
jgi:DnaJ family protein C protein 27